MPCQCGSTVVAEREAAGLHGECACATGSEGSCECASGSPTPSDHAASLERIVMELDKRVRRLEASR